MEIKNNEIIYNIEKLLLEIESTKLYRIKKILEEHLDFTRMSGEMYLYNKVIKIIGE